MDHDIPQMDLQVKHAASMSSAAETADDLLEPARADFHSPQL